MYPGHQQILTNDLPNIVLQDDFNLKQDFSALPKKILVKFRVSIRDLGHLNDQTRIDLPHDDPDHLLNPKTTLNFQIGQINHFIKIVLEDHPRHHFPKNDPKILLKKDRK